MLVDVSCSSATLAIRRITQMHPPEVCHPEAALARPLEEFPFGLQPQILQVYIPYGPIYPEFESLRILTQLKQERRKIFSRCPVNAILAENVCLHAATPRLYSWWLVSTCIDTSRALVLPKMRILFDLWQVTDMWFIHIYPKIGTPQKGHLRPKHNDKTKHDKTNHRILGVPCHTVISYPFISYFSTHPLPLKSGRDTIPRPMPPWLHTASSSDVPWQILADLGSLECWDVAWLECVFRCFQSPLKGDAAWRCYVKAMKFIFKPLNCVGPWCKKKKLQFAQQSSNV